MNVEEIVDSRTIYLSSLLFTYYQFTKLYSKNINVKFNWKQHINELVQKTIIK